MGVVVHDVPLPDEVLTELGVQRYVQIDHESWAASQSSFPEGGVDFLQDAYLLSYISLLRLPKDLIEAFFSVFRTLRASPAAQRWVWYCQFVFAQQSGETVTRVCSHWPELTSLLGEHAPMFTAVVALSALPRMVALYREKGLPDSILRDTLSDFLIVMEDYRDKHAGRWGLSLIDWLYYHFTGKLFKLGRLQFKPGTFGQDIRVFRQNGADEVRVLSGDGVAYDQRGLRIPADKEDSGLGVWRATLTLEPGVACGHPLTTDAVCQRQMVRLSLDEWDEVLARGAKILEVHIPKGDRLTSKSCWESYNWAVQFYADLCPETRFMALTCESWILDPQLRRMLSPSANIVRFQNDYHQYPVPFISDGDDIFDYVFDGRPADLATAPRDTRLRRAVLDHLAAGGWMQFSGGFMLLDPDTGRLIPRRRGSTC
ncbi:MAG: DUF5596 domain-containing protein [Chloroflexi bacterium]|nr:DUF5596 domain-containing protein [Chloroflexota bacterium]